MLLHWGHPFSTWLIAYVNKRQNKNVIEWKYSLYTKVAQYTQVYCIVTSYTLETKENTVPVFTNSNQVSKWQFLAHAHFMSHPMWVITREAK